MSLHLDYAEISREARKIVDANRARSVLQSQATQQTVDPDGPRKRVKFTRSTKGCLQCRQHKVKCDETTPTCLRCVASQRLCEYPPPRQSNQRSRKGSSQLKESDWPERKQSPEAGPSRTSNGHGGQGGHVSMGPTAAGSGSGSGSGGGGTNGGIDRFKNTFGLSESSSSVKQLSPSELFNITPSGTNSVSPNKGGSNMSSPDLSFLHELIPDLNSANTLNPFYPQTSPTSTLPVNWGVLPSKEETTPPLPQFTNMAKSLLLARRVGKGKDAILDPRGLSATPPTTLPARVAVVDNLLQAFAFDEVLFEFGPSHRQRALSVNSSLTSTDILSNAFPSPVARTLFHHYTNYTSKILITMGNIGPNPLLSLCTPFRLLDTNSAASAAMRMSMLSTSVAHFAHETEEAVGKMNLGAAWIGQKAQLKAMSQKFKKAAVSNILLSASSDGGNGGTQQVDSLLAACTLLCVRDVISADTTWRDNMEFVLNLISKKGGPQAMLKPAEYSFTRRYLLENLATHDVFSSFITGKEPALLGNYDSWWFDSVETSTTRWEWESVERTFGISRAMVDLVARIAVLDSHKRRLGISLKGHPDELWDAGQHFIRESHCLLLELDIWGNSLNALPQHHRVTCGDYIYKYMAVVYILGEILEQPITTTRISTAIDHILELCSEASAMRMSVMLIWPLLIAGVFSRVEKREKVRSLFDAYHSDYCEDLDAARDLLEEQWRLIDSGVGKQPWVDVMKKLDKNVLLI